MTSSSDLRLVLASRSPQREAILRQLRIPFRIVASRHVETGDGDDPGALVEGNARGKALEVAGRVAAQDREFVLGVDTVVVLDGVVFGKAGSAAEAREFLARLGGRTHRVYSGLCLLEGRREVCGHARTEVSMRALGSHEIDDYVATGEWRERAGAYAIQGIGSALVESVAGDYWNVVGLPVALLVDELARLGHAPFSWAGGAGGGAVCRVGYGCASVYHEWSTESERSPPSVC